MNFGTDGQVSGSFDQGHGQGQPQLQQPYPPPPQCIPVNPSNPFYNNLPSVIPVPRTDLSGATAGTALERINRYNPTSNSTFNPPGRGRGSPRGRGRGRGRRDEGFHKKTPRYHFPERPDYGPVKFIAEGEGDKEDLPDEADAIPIPMAQPQLQRPQGYPGQEYASSNLGQRQSGEVVEMSEAIPGIVSFSQEAGPEPELTMMDVAKMTRMAKKRALDRGVGAIPDPAIIKRLKVTPDKPATAILNELNPGLQYVVEDVTQVLTNPKFVCRVTFPVGENGKEYVGESRSKKLAKSKAAEKVLRGIGVEFPENEDTKPCPGPSEPEPEQKIVNMDPWMVPQPFFPVPGMNPSVSQFHDFTADEDVVMSSTDFSLSNVNQFPRPQEAAANVTDVFKRLKNIPNFEKNALCALNSLVGGDGHEFEDISENGPPHDKKFIVKLCLKTGMTFEGVGSSKQRAKHQAGKQALMALIGPQMYQDLVSHSSMTVQVSNPQTICAAVSTRRVSEEMPQIPSVFINEDSVNASEYDITFSDYIARIVNDKYEEIMEDHQEHISQKVLAGVVMTRSYPMLENGQVISVATGTKCVEGDFMSTDGLAVNDCHAEILATRCLRDFLYSEIENICCATTDEERQDSILVELKTESGDILYEVKSDVKFHLYISTSPCGDARIFSPKGLETDEEKDGMDELEDSHPSKRNRGVLRAKVEAGEGTIPVNNLISGPQTFDSIVQGNALFTMSCSDKVCRWNVVGVQGALLSNLMNPVYYSSITLGSLHHPVHFRRAVLGRIEALAGKVPLPFKINRAHLLMISHQEKRVVKKSPNHAICWATGWSTPEILAASKGRCEPGGVASRLAKRMAFIRFLTLFRNETGQRSGFADLSYKEAKLLAQDYQISTQVFRAHMRVTNLGSWISKPVEIDSFYISK